MKSWLIVNSFVNSEKFLEIYELIREQAVKHGIEMEIKRTDELMCDVLSDFRDFDLPPFAIFWDKISCLREGLKKWESGFSILRQL